MTAYHVTRAHLKNAVDAKQWDLLDKLLEIDASHVNDRSYYTDTWGEWWGLLLECIYRGSEKGVRVLLKHGADRELGNWGDCLPITPIEAAKDKPKIAALIASAEPITYSRTQEPQLPSDLSVEDRAVNQQGHIRDETGLVFQTSALKKG